MTKGLLSLVLKGVGLDHESNSLDRHRGQKEWARLYDDSLYPGVWKRSADQQLPGCPEHGYVFTDPHPRVPLEQAKAAGFNSRGVAPCCPSVASHIDSKKSIFHQPGP